MSTSRFFQLKSTSSVMKSSRYIYPILVFVDEDLEILPTEHEERLVEIDEKTVAAEAGEKG